MARLTIVIPTYNERENIGKLIDEIERVLSNLGERNFKILIVDDGSPDGTADVAREAGKRYGNVIVIDRGAKLGIGSAVLTGMRRALEEGCEYILTMDADFSHDPNDLPKFLEKMREGYDLIQGSRYVRGGRIEGWSLWRRIISYLANLLVRTLLKTGLRENTTYYRAYSRRLSSLIVSRIGEEVDGYEFAVISAKLAREVGARVVEVPITFRERRAGESKLGPRDMLKWLSTVLRAALRLGKYGKV